MNIIIYGLLLVNLFQKNVLGILEYNKTEYKDDTQNDLDIFLTLYNYTSLFEMNVKNANYIFEDEEEYFYGLYGFRNFSCVINDYSNSFICDIKNSNNIFLELTQCGNYNLSCYIVTELNNVTLGVV